MTRNVREKLSCRILGGGPVFSYLARKPCCSSIMFVVRQSATFCMGAFGGEKRRLGMKSGFGLRDALCGQCAVGWLGRLFLDLSAC